MLKILINLHSKQTIPNYVAIKEFNPDRVMAFSTPEYVDQVKVFEEISGIEHTLTIIDAYDLEQNFIIIQKLINEISNENEIIINYTGGTKIMVVSLILKVLISAEQKLSFVYINTFGKSIEYLELSEAKELSIYSKSIKTKVLIDTYVLLEGEKIKTYTDTPSEQAIDRFVLSEALLLDRNLNAIFKKQKTFFEKQGRAMLPRVVHSLTTERFDLVWNTQMIRLQMKNKNFNYNHSDGGAYFSGAWLEEYVFFKLKESKYFDETLANVKFDFTSFEVFNKPDKDKIFKNEIDIVVSKGLKTVFIECKAGYVSQDYVYKLQSIRNHFLGTFGEAVLLTKFPQKENIIEKCNDANIHLVSGDEIQNIDSVINQLIK